MHSPNLYPLQEYSFSLADHSFKFAVYSYFDTATQHQHGRDEMIDRELHTSRASANRAARSFLQRGLWVEVYDDDTRELLAGPFDPDLPAPSYIV